MGLDYEIAVRLLLSVILGSAIGFERQWHQGMAGLRTNALVSLGSALFVSVTILTSDPSPTRVAAMVVSGIGFLCAGVIMRQGFSVIGLNTAATLWCSASVGVLCGMGGYVTAAVGSFLVIISNMILRRISWRLDARQPAMNGATHYLLRIACSSARVSDVRLHVLTELSDGLLGLRALQSEQIEPDKVEVRADLVSKGRADEEVERLVAKLAIASEVQGIRWEIPTSEEMLHPPVYTPPKGPFG